MSCGQRCYSNPSLLPLHLSTTVLNIIIYNAGLWAPGHRREKCYFKMLYVWKET